MANQKGPTPIYRAPLPEIRRRIRVYYFLHPRAKAAVRIGILAPVLLVLFLILDREGYLRAAYAFPAYSVLATALGLVVAVISLLGVRGQFKVLVPPNDPGHHFLPYKGVSRPPQGGRIRVPGSMVPGTYPKEMVGDSARRGDFQWNHPPGKSDTFRTLQYKFGAVAILACRRDAKEAHAHAMIRVNKGTAGSFEVGVWNSAGQLNWYYEAWEERLNGDGRLDQGVLTQPTLDAVFESPLLGLNKFLNNPEVTIHRDQFHYLPIFYMRDDRPEVFVCGQLQAQTIGPTLDGSPIEFDLEVVVSALDFRITKVWFHCTAKWDVLTVEGLTKRPQ